MSSLLTQVTKDLKGAMSPHSLGVSSEQWSPFIGHSAFPRNTYSFALLCFPVKEGRKQGFCDFPAHWGPGSDTWAPVCCLITGLRG